MCGIFGSIGFDERLPSESLWRANSRRGRDAWGYASPAYEYREGGPWMEQRMPELGRAPFLANLRAEPTTEWVRNIKPSDIQPYQVGDWTIVHNGTIANDKELLATHGWRSPTRVDSWVIAALCDRFGFEGMLTRIRGSYAILAYRRGQDDLYWATNYRPLYRIHSWPYAGHVLSSEPLSDQDEPLPQYAYGSLSIEGDLYIRSNPRYPRTLRHRSLAVCSGGLDSTVAAHWMMRMGHEVELFHIDYGCRATAAEVRAVEALADRWSIPLHVARTPLFTELIGGSRLTSTKEAVADGEAGAEYAFEWVPARNLIMLALATGFAEAQGFTHLTLGANLEEAGAYPDNEPEFLRRFKALLPFATGDGKRLDLVTPVGNLMKHEIVSTGIKLGTPFELTWSCYENGDKHCGHCGPCFMRKTAFEINGTTDPVFKEDRT